jgi:hypothetical protein
MNILFKEFLILLVLLTAQQIVELMDDWFVLPCFLLAIFLKVGSKVPDDLLALDRTLIRGNSHEATRNLSGRLVDCIFREIPGS